MFKIQEDHVRKILIVALTVNAAMTNVSKLVKAIMTAHMKMIVWTIFACPRYVEVVEIVLRAKTVLMNIVPFHQVIICVIYFSIWHSLTEINKRC